MEDVGAVFVDVDAGNGFGVDVAGDMAAAVDHQAALAGLGQFPGEDRAVQTGTDDQIIIGHKDPSFLWP